MRRSLPVFAQIVHLIPAGLIESIAKTAHINWKIMEEYVDAGKIRAIGLSNFNPHHVEALLKYVEGWAPLGQGGAVLQDPAIADIAERHGKSIAQVILRWNRQRGLIAIPRCDNPDYTEENIDMIDFELSPAELGVINGLIRNERTNAINDPDNFPW